MSLPSSRAGRSLPHESGSVLDLGDIQIVIQKIHHDRVVGSGLEQKGILGCGAAGEPKDHDPKNQDENESYG